MIDRAKAANWAGGKAGDVARSHFDKHRHLLGIADQSAYNQGAIDNIRRAGSDVYLSVRDGSLRASFVRPATRIDSKGGKRKGVAVSIVDIEANRLVSYHFKEKMTSTVDEVPPMKQGGWGIVKWLIG